MAITFNETTRIFTLTTAHTTYQMQADAQGYLLHLYYGARTAGEMDYLLNYGDRGFSGNPNSAGSDRTYSLDALPQEYPSLGTGDFRNYALNIENADGSQCCNPVYITHEIAAGKYSGNFEDYTGRSCYKSRASSALRSTGKRRYYHQKCDN